MTEFSCAYVDGCLSAEQAILAAYASVKCPSKHYLIFLFKLTSKTDSNLSNLITFLHLLKVVHKTNCDQSSDILSIIRLLTLSRASSASQSLDNECMFVKKNNRL